MARLIILAVLIVAVAFGLMLAVSSAARSAQRAVGSVDMGGNVSILAYLALILLMLGVCSGLLGGL